MKCCVSLKSSIFMCLVCQKFMLMVKSANWQVEMLRIFSEICSKLLLSCGIIMY